MGLDRMIEQAHKQKYAVIKEIEMSPSEVRELVIEVERHEDKEERLEIKKLFKVVGEDANASVLNLFALDKDFVEKWFKGVYTVTYKDVVLRVKPESNKTEG